MALRAFPHLSTRTRLTDGTNYAYVSIAPADPAKPTFLLLHGFPSSSWDWRHQIRALHAQGYGVIAPDLLGYGDTDKPGEVEAYAMKRMSAHVDEILEREGVKKCVGVAHDWGCGLISRLATYYPQRFYGIVTVSVSYVEPGLIWDIDAFCALTEQAFGYATFGYWKWFNTDEAAAIFDANQASVFSLIYPSDPELWKASFCPVGGARDYISAGKTTPLPAWMSVEETQMRDEIFSEGGYTGPLNWYKSGMRGVNLAAESQLPPAAKQLTIPNLLVVAEKDYATRADVQSQRATELVQNARIEVLDCGHWIQLERREELVKLLVGFAEEVAKDQVAKGQVAKDRVGGRLGVTEE